MALGRRYPMQGIIAGTGFASGDRVVVGHWAASPIGPFSDVMWARPSGERLLYVADERAGRFITAVYEFDRVEVGPLEVEGDDRKLAVRGADLELRLAGGWARRLPGPRPAWVTRYLEAPVARGLMGVRTYGVSPTGVREWYRASGWRWLETAAGSLRGQDLGAMAPVEPAAGFGFSEPPRRPSITAVRPLLEDPSGHLDEVLSSLAG